MTKRLLLSVAALALGAGLLVTAAFAGKSPSSASKPSAKAAAGKTGGTLRVNLQSDTDYVDPALAYYQTSWQFEYVTCAKLLNYPDKPKPAGSQLQPELATSMPKVSANGLTYTFTIKSGKSAYKFNTGQVVTAKNVAYAIQRDLNPKMQSPAASFLTDILQGADAYNSGKASSISGVVVKGNTLAIKLIKPAPDLLARLAMPFFCAIPTNLPIVPEGVHSLPGAGPYYVASWTPNRQIVLKRNPQYKGPRPHNLDNIVYTVGVDLNATLLQVKQGQSDYAGDGLNPTAWAPLGQQYGVNKSQVWVNPTLSFRYLALNTSRPLFSNRKLRQAVGYAIDRPTLIRNRGKYAGIRADHYLPPGLQGSPKNQSVKVGAAGYPLVGANPAKAKQVAGNVGNATAVLYTCNAGVCPTNAQVIQYNLKQIGINVDVKQFVRGVQFQKEGVKGEPFDIAYEGWIADYADPFDFINILMDGTTIHETNNVNFSYFNNASYNKKMAAAAKLSGSARYAAYQKLDIDLAKNEAPLQSWIFDTQRDFFSSKVDPKCLTYQPVYTMDLAAICLK
jgi:ABC-type oligopeptide transport system substrate-binding subunit